MRPIQFLGGLALPVFLATTTLTHADEPADLAAQEQTAEALEALPANLGLGLRELIQEVQTKGDVVTPESEQDGHIQRDQRRRVLVNITLDGSKTIAQMRAEVEAHGGEVTAAIPWYRQGVLSAWIPIGRAADLARRPGLRAMRLSPRPKAHVGLTTSQGAVVHKTVAVNQTGYDGSGITIGAISDSYDANTADRNSTGFTRASEDVENGDLPGPQNPNGHLDPVNVVQEARPSSRNTDEGRGMLQIIHDLAPGSKLAFATSGSSEPAFAQNILDLRSEGNCQVMVDDIGFSTEPLFSDGIVAQAVDQVAALGVHYFASAGNDGNSGYSATYTPIDMPAAKIRLDQEGINLGTIPKGIRNRIQDWHSFGTDEKGRPVLVQKIFAVSRTFIGFQWDDPFDVQGPGDNSAVTTDFDIFVFDTAGNFILNRSGLDKNMATNEPIEFAYLGPKTRYKICIVRTTKTNGVDPQSAMHIAYNANANSPITGDYITPSNPTTVGHSDAAGASGVAAFDYDVSPAAPDDNGPHEFSPGVESFSSNGPITIYLDDEGNRLPTPELRLQPIFAGVDNVNTSFFPPGPISFTDTDNDNFPNFSGTSAAAPHAAAIAALVLHAAAANSKTAPTPAAMRQLLLSTTQGLTDQDPSYCAATAGPVTISATGENPEDKNTFTIAFNGAAGQALTSVTIDLSPTSIHFDPSKKLGFPLTIGKRTGPTIAKLASPPIYSGGTSDATPATVIVALKKFVSGDTLNFGIDRDNNSSDMYGNSVDLLDGATISVTVDGTVYNGNFANVLSKAYNYKVGYGLLDAQAAVNALLAP